MFAGSLTNTPALAGELEYLKEYGPAADREQTLAEPVVGYSVTYPIGVLGFIVAMFVAQRAWKIDYRHEARRVRDIAESPQQLENRTIRVTHPAATSLPIKDLIKNHGWDVVFGRLRRDGKVEIVTADTHLRVGDLVTVVGTEEDLDRVALFMGAPSDEHIELDRSQLDYRRIFVSEPAVVGHQLRDLKLPDAFGAVVTRVRRGDVEFLPQADTVLEPGDRVRVVAPRNAIPAIYAILRRFLSCAERNRNASTFSLGLALGLLVGALPIPLSWWRELKLGLAGGPLIVALVLGTLDRTGPLVWTIPYSANLTLRQFGLILFLAGVGTRAGYAFVSTMRGGDGIVLLCAGALITFSVALSVLWVGYRLLRIPMGLLIGMAAGLQTQPAALGFALEQSEDELPNLGYAGVFPLATIAKIIAAQVLLAVLLR